MNVPWKFHWNQIIISLLIGAALGSVYGQWHAHEEWRGHWKKGGMRQFMLEKFSRKLHLNAEQKAQVAAIFDEKHPQMMALQAEMQPKFRALRESAQSQIRAILNPDQQKKLDEMHAKMEERWKDREKFFAS